ncbi:hypothetical protein S1361_38405 [Streptomyces cyanogenus]|uniref:Uncharacterized protein n=1 Tax=Streptomyces cyanogenus TaxID=80860 RepID=A0ABX7TJH2_STRCY|nr:hypothetical protein S1361_00095 [Streptomyces cyanogenus]QTE03272.1 hypothetical protein S1361_38405 [Streptomyces cyanogenus]
MPEKVAASRAVDRTAAWSSPSSPKRHAAARSGTDSVCMGAAHLATTAGTALVERPRPAHAPLRGRRHAVHRRGDGGAQEEDRSSHVTWGMPYADAAEGKAERGRRGHRARCPRRPRRPAAGSLLQLPSLLFRMRPACRSTTVGEGPYKMADLLATIRRSAGPGRLTASQSTPLPVRRCWSPSGNRAPLGPSHAARKIEPCEMFSSRFIRHDRGIPLATACWVRAEPREGWLPIASVSKMNRAKDEFLSILTLHDKCTLITVANLLSCIALVHGTAPGGQGARLC